MLVVKALHISLVVASVRWAVLPAANFRQSGHGAGRQSGRARSPAVDGRQTVQFMTPLGILAVLFGLWLWFGYSFSGGWLHAKTALVALLVAYHVHCAVLLNAFRAGRNTRSHVWFRFYNEMPVVVLFAVVFLAVLKPF